MDLSISKVINVSVLSAQAGLGQYNTSNLAIFTEEARASSFGAGAFKIYYDAASVGLDFGTASKTYAKAVGIFSQQPNILAGSGYLVVVPVLAAKQTFTPSGIPASGTVVLGGSAPINWNDTAAQIQTKLRAVSGLSGVVVTGSLATVLHVEFAGVYGPVAPLAVTANSLQTSGAVAVTIPESDDLVGESLLGAITRARGLIQFFGLCKTMTVADADLLAAAQYVQTLNKIMFAGFRSASQAADGGIIDQIRLAGLDQTRCLYFGDLQPIDMGRMVASYASRMLSVVFSGSNTASTMHMKDLKTMAADSTLDETLALQLEKVGADYYGSFQGVPKVFSAGANNYADRVYNRQWFIGAIQVAGFNALATVATKLPQTESGMKVLKSAYRQVAEQAITNGYLAPGTWTDPYTFGVQSDFLDNILQRGYYIYSAPITAQLAADRAARKAPLCQIAIKEAGAMHSANIVISLNA